MRLGRVLIRIINTRESLNLTRPGLRIHSTLIGLFAVLKRGGDVDEVEASILFNRLLCLFAGVLERRDGGSNDGGSSAGEFTRDESDALKVLVAVLAREAEFAGELLADVFAEEQGGGTAALLVKRNLERTGDGVLARVGEAGEEDGETLLVAGGVGLAEDLDDFRVGEPFRNRGAGAETTTEFGSGDVERFHAGLNFIDGCVVVGIREIGHHLERDDFDAEFFLILLDGVLCVVRSVEIVALGVRAGTGVVAADDEVGCAVVLADDGVPDCFARTAHAHGEREEAEGGHAVGVAGEEGLVDTDAGEVVDVAGLGEADDGVDEDIGLAGAGGADGKLTMSAVHGVAGLEGDNLGPAELVEVGAKLGGGVYMVLVVGREIVEVRIRTAKLDVVVVLKLADGLELSSDVEFLCGVVEVDDGGVLLISTEDVECLLGPV